MSVSVSAGQLWELELLSLCRAVASLDLLVCCGDWFPEARQSQPRMASLPSNWGESSCVSHSWFHISLASLETALVLHG